MKPRGTWRLVALAWLMAGMGHAQSLTPAQALEQYLETHQVEDGCSGVSFTVQIDASLPKLKKHGTMSGLKLLSETGHTVYRGLEFTGDRLVKTDVIARYLKQDSDDEERNPGDGVTRQNYSFEYVKTAGYNNLSAFVFHLKPKRKARGLFEGELWLDAGTAAPLRLWGDFVKSPSIFVRSFRFVADYQDRNECVQPARLLVTADTRIAGPMEMSVWQHFVARDVSQDFDRSR